MMVFRTVDTSSELSVGGGPMGSGDRNRPLGAILPRPGELRCRTFVAISDGVDRSGIPGHPGPRWLASGDRMANLRRSQGPREERRDRWTLHRFRDRGGSLGPVRSSDRWETRSVPGNRISIGSSSRRGGRILESDILFDHLDEEASQNGDRNKRRRLS